ncbi:MAG: PAS and ANTAR domain-containing protein [Nocardioidaceae bacterium]
MRLTTEMLLGMRHPEDRDRVAAEIKSALATAEPFSCYHRSLDRNDRIHRVVAVGAGAMDADGTLVAMEGYLIDLTPDVSREAHTAADRAVAAATEHRSAIEQAKGVLMGVFAIDEDSAFSMLRWFSQQHNIKLSLLATRLVAEVSSGEAADLQTRERVDRLIHDLATAPDSCAS